MRGLRLVELLAGVFSGVNFVFQVRKFETIGEVSWITEIRTLRPIEVVERPRSISLRVPPEGYDEVRSMFDIDGRELVIQVARYPAPKPRRSSNLLSPVSLATYVVDLQSGSDGFATDRLQEMSVVWKDGWIGVRQLPFPQATVYVRLAAGTAR